MVGTVAEPASLPGTYSCTCEALCGNNMPPHNTTPIGLKPPVQAFSFQPKVPQHPRGCSSWKCTVTSSYQSPLEQHAQGNCTVRNCVFHKERARSLEDAKTGLGAFVSRWTLLWLSGEASVLSGRGTGVPVEALPMLSCLWWVHRSGHMGQAG